MTKYHRRHHARPFGLLRASWGQRFDGAELGGAKFDAAKLGDAKLDGAQLPLRFCCSAGCCLVLMFYELTWCRAMRYQVLTLCETDQVPPRAPRQTIRSATGQLSWVGSLMARSLMSQGLASVSVITLSVAWC